PGALLGPVAELPRGIEPPARDRAIRADRARVLLPGGKRDRVGDTGKHGGVSVGGVASAELAYVVMPPAIDLPGVGARACILAAGDDLADRRHVDHRDGQLRRIRRAVAELAVGVVSRAHDGAVLAQEAREVLPGGSGGRIDEP